MRKMMKEWFNLAAGKLTQYQRPSWDIIYRQMEAYSYLLDVVKPIRPLPPMRGSAIAPDFALQLLECYLDVQPRTTVELGSGVSTLLQGYFIKNNKFPARVLSLDHDPVFARITSENLRKHGVAEFATVAVAPLKEYRIVGKAYDWYDLKPLEAVGSIDLLIVDGPPAVPGRASRYPALPLLLPKLSEKAVVILDDANRAEEQGIVADWLKEFPGFRQEFLRTEKGTVLLRRG